MVSLWLVYLIISFMYTVPPVCDTLKAKLFYLFVFLLRLPLNIAVVYNIKRVHNVLVSYVNDTSKHCEGLLRLSSIQYNTI